MRSRASALGAVLVGLPRMHIDFHCTSQNAIHLLPPHMAKYLLCRCVSPEWMAVIYPLGHTNQHIFFTLTK